MSTNGARANQYAQAIMQVMVERWQTALTSVATALQADQQLYNTLSNGATPVDERVAALEQIIPADVPAELRNTLKLMVQDGSIGLVGELGDALAQVTTGKAAPTKAEVTSAVELTAEEQEKMRSTLATRYGRELVFSFHVDPSLMGGLRVRVGDRLIDTSVASRLQSMRESLANVVR